VRREECHHFILHSLFSRYPIPMSHFTLHTLFSLVPIPDTCYSNPILCFPLSRYPCLVKKWAVGSSSGQFVTLEPYRSNLNYFKHFKILFSFFIRPIRVICDLFFHLFNQTHKILCFFIRQIRVNCVPFFTHSIKPTKILSPFIRQIRVIRVPFFLPNNQTY